MISGIITTLVAIWFVVALVLASATYFAAKRNGRRLAKVKTFLDAAIWPKWIYSAVKWWVRTSLSQKG
jgi:hypothetical protein